MSPDPIENRNIIPRDLLQFIEDKTAFHFRKCSFDGYDFDEFDIEDFTFEECTMDGAVFYNTELENCSFIKTSLQKVEFSKCSISNCSFDSCNMSNASFSDSSCKSKIYWTRFKDCKMTGVNFNSFRSSKVTFENCILRLAYFYGFNFRDQALKGLDLGDADVCDCIFDNAILDGSSLRNANFKGVNSFQNTDLRLCDISGVKPEKIMGAFISPDQATEILSKLNIKVL